MKPLKHIRSGVKFIMMKHLVAAVLVGVAFLCLQAQAASSGAKHPIDMHWPFDGAFGTFDRASIQRGFQVYKEVCSACHSMKYLSYRNLEQVGFSEAEVKAIAASVTVTDGPNDDGDMFERAGRPSDPFKSPFANDKAAAAANGGAIPPDLSLMAKARPNGPDYIYSLLVGYKEPMPADFHLQGALSYNPYFPGGQLAMAQPLNDGQVEYQDGTEASLDQMAKDVVNFLQWAAEPEMEDRKRMGFKVLFFLGVFTVFFYIAKVRVWSKIRDEN